MRSNYYNRPEAKVAVYLGKRMIDLTDQRDIQPDTDVFRRVIASVKEILEDIIISIPSETKDRNRRIKWNEVTRIPAYSIRDVVDMDEEEFWEVINRQIPMLVDAASVVVKMDERGDFY